MYDNVPNFGDMLNKHIWGRYFGPYLSHEDKVLMFGIGTVLGEDIGDAEQVIVCGSGCGYSRKIDRIDTSHFHIFFVRGKLTAKLLGLPDSIAITDPGILTPESFPPGPKHGRVVYVPHWESSSNPLWKIACERAGIEYVDPLGDIDEIMRSISGAKLVIAEAMHAAIVADSYRVPWVAVTTSARINQFKWNDWAGSLEMVPTFFHFAPLGPSDYFRTLTSSKDKEIRLEEVKDMKEEGASSSSGPKAVLKKIYKVLVPAFIRNRKDDFLNHKLGPVLDRILAAWVQAGLPSPAMKRTVRAFERLKQSAEGQLSDESLSRQRVDSMHRKLEEVRVFLEKRAA
ncbi:MAG: polysaccharide pyruvyl transferase family protein [Alphaproteobacteria bacterium]|nr:polysaccharide pyruvyl transferase family protein [Alphaproteobacteria bacterium]